MLKFRCASLGHFVNYQGVVKKKDMIAADTVDCPFNASTKTKGQNKVKY